MKKFVATLVVGSVLASSFANAQALPGVSGPAVGNQTVTTPGNYNMSQISLDNTRVLMALLSQQSKVADIDRDYLSEIVVRLNNHTIELINLQQRFMQLGLKSKTTTTVTLDQYLNLVNQIRAKESILSSEIQTQTLITRESLPSYSPLEVAGVQASAVSSGNVNMTPVMTRFEALRAKIMGEINNVSFGMVLTPLHQQVPVPAGDALNPTLDGLQILSPAQIQRYRNDIAEASGFMGETRILANGMVELNATLIRNFVNAYGNSEWLRSKDENDNKARAEAFQSITNAFFYRSYLRKAYGVRIGAMQSTGYPKRFLNVEKFALQPLKEALSSFRNQAATTEPELLAAFESARNFVQLYDEKVTPAFAKKKAILARKDKKEDYSSNDTGFLVRANSFWTKATGQTRIAEGLLMVMRLVLADIREEMMLSRGEILEQKAYHDARYRALPELKTAANKKICAIDYTMPPTSFAKNCGPLGFTRQPGKVQGDQRSMLPTVQNMIGQLKDVESARAANSQRLQALIDAASKSGDPAASEQAADEQFN